MEVIDRKVSDEDLKLWQAYVQAASAMWSARKELFTESSSLVEVIRAGLDKPGERAAALEIVGFLKEDERKCLFSELLMIAGSYSGSTGFARDFVLSLPKDWLLANIEEAAERLLRNGTYEEYRALFEIYIRLDRDLAYKLAHRAAKHSDPDIKEAGDDFLQTLAVD